MSTGAGTDLNQQRRFFADEIAAVANLQSPRLIEALAAVPREGFLPPGPWHVASEGTVSGPTRVTADADPRHVYHNYSVAIDAPRQLYNGAPGVIAGAIDRLAVRPGARVLHIGAGRGYYSALLGHVVGPSGRVVAVEVDPQLAAAAGDALAAMSWVTVHERWDPVTTDAFDAILVNTGVTHPQAAWLDALAPGGSLLVPLTASIPAMGPLSKGVMTLITRTPEGPLTARVLTPVVIYSAIGLRDDALNEVLGRALMRNPFPRLTRLRRDAHQQTPACWLHGDGFCLTTE